MDENTKAESWDIWQSVCRDKVVVRLSIELEKQKKIFLPSVAAPFQNGVQVLASMSEQQISALKKRLGVLCAAK